MLYFFLVLLGGMNLAFAEEPNSESSSSQMIDNVDDWDQFVEEEVRKIEQEAALKAAATRMVLRPTDKMLDFLGERVLGQADKVLYYFVVERYEYNRLVINQCFDSVPIGETVYVTIQHQRPERPSYTMILGSETSKAGTFSYSQVLTCFKEQTRLLLRPVDENRIPVNGGPYYYPPFTFRVDVVFIFQHDVMPPIQISFPKE